MSDKLSRTYSKIFISKAAHTTVKLEAKTSRWGLGCQRSGSSKWSYGEIFEYHSIPAVVDFWPGLVRRNKELGDQSSHHSAMLLLALDLVFIFLSWMSVCLKFPPNFISQTHYWQPQSLSTLKIVPRIIARFVWFAFFPHASLLILSSLYFRPCTFKHQSAQKCRK